MDHMRLADMKEKVFIYEAKISVDRGSRTFDEIP